MLGFQNLTLSIHPTRKWAIIQPTNRGDLARKTVFVPWSLLCTTHGVKLDEFLCHYNKA
jgi:hypothetical protein